MLTDTELFCDNRPVTLRLGEQHQKVGVVQNVFNLPAGQKVFDILRERRGDTALFAEHLPHRHKVAGGQRVAQEDMELVKVAPCRHAVLVVGVHRRCDKIVGDVHRNLAEVFTQPFQHNAHHTGTQVHVGRAVEQVKGACAVELQRGRHTFCLGLRLFEQFLVQVLEQRHFCTLQPQGKLPVHQPHTAVNHRFLYGLQTILAAHHQLTEGKQEVRFHGQRAVLVIEPHLNIHRVNVVGAVRGNLNDLPAQPPHQRGIFPHRVNDNDAVLGSKENIDKLPLGGKALAGARGAQVHPVCGFQLFPVSHDDIVGKRVHAVVEGLPAHAELPCHKGNENRRGAGRHAPLDLHLVIAQGQRGHKALFLLPVQPFQSAVVFLCNAGNGEHIVFQPLAGGGQVDDSERQEEHPLISGLQIPQELRRVLGKGDKVGGQNIHVIPGADGLFLFLHFHAVNVRDFPLDRLDRL